MKRSRSPSLALALALPLLALIACSGSVAVAPGGSSTTTSSTSGTGGTGGMATTSTGGAAGMPGDVAWSKRFTYAYPAVTTDDESIFVGVDLGDGNPPYDWHLLAIDGAGNIGWDGHPAPGQPQRGADGSLRLVGAFDESGTNILGTSLSCDQTCAFAARIDAGMPTWARTYTPADLGVPDVDVAWSGPSTGVGADGRIGIQADMGKPSTYEQDVVVGEVSETGDFLWKRVITAPQNPFGVGDRLVTPAGDLVIAGYMSDGIDLGSGLQSSAVVPPPTVDAFLARYSPAGDFVFHRSIALASDTEAYLWGLRIDPAGNLLFGAGITGIYDLGAGPMGSPGESETIVAKLDPSGALLFRIVIAGTGQKAPTIPALASGAAGDTWACMTSFPGQTFAGQPIVSAGDSDVVLLHYDAAGMPLSMRQFGGPGHDTCTSVAVTPSGAPILEGSFQDSIDFGQGPLTAIGDHNVFVAKLAP